MLAFRVVQECLTTITVAEDLFIVTWTCRDRDFIVFQSANKWLVIVLFACRVWLVQNLYVLKVHLIHLLGRAMEYQLYLEVLVSDNCVDSCIIPFLPPPRIVVLDGTFGNRIKLRCFDTWPIIGQLTFLDYNCFLSYLLVCFWLSSVFLSDDLRR